MGILYLIESNDYLKIGFALDLEKRLKAYLTHNPEFQVIAKRKGIMKDEIFLHKLFELYLIKGEWMKYSEHIVNQFEKIILPSSYFITFRESITLTSQLGNNAKNILMWICYNMEFNSNKIHLSKLIREQLAKETGICEDTITNNLATLKKLKLIVKSDENYIVNPLFFWKGELDIREKVLKNHSILFSVENFKASGIISNEVKDRRFSFKINCDDLVNKYGNLDESTLIELSFKEQDIYLLNFL